MKDLIRRLGSVADRLGKAEEDLWNILEELRLRTGEKKGDDLETRDKAELRRLLRTRRKKPVDLVAKGNAEKGVEDVKITRAADGHARVRIAGLHEISLTPRLATLLTILCIDAGSSGDGDELVPWKNWTEVAQLLGLGKRPDKKANHAVRNLAWRLQAALHNGGYNRHWVQRNEKGDLRFALRRKPKELVIQ